MARVDQLIRLLRGGGQGEVESSSSDISSVRSLRFPADYLDTVNEMGSGFSLDEKLSILHPRVIERDLVQHQRDLESIHQSEGIYFQHGGLASPEEMSLGWDYVTFSSLICWGLDNSGKKLFWDASKEVGQWSLVATDCSVSWVRHKMTFSDYLYGIITRSLICPVFTQPSWPRGFVSHLLLHRIDF